MSAPFEAGMTPVTGQPCLRLNFANGWSGQLLLHTLDAKLHFALDAATAGVGACPTGKWGTGQTELGSQECTPEQAIAFLAEVAARPAL